MQRSQMMKIMAQMLVISYVVPRLRVTSKVPLLQYTTKTTNRLISYTQQDAIFNQNSFDRKQYIIKTAYRGISNQGASEPFLYGGGELRGDENKPPLLLSHSKNTAKSTKSRVTVFREWTSARNCPDDILERPEVSILDFQLNRFVAEVRRSAGQPSYVDAAYMSAGSSTRSATSSAT